MVLHYTTHDPRGKRTYARAERHGRSIISGCQGNMYWRNAAALKQGTQQQPNPRYSEVLQDHYAVEDPSEDEPLNSKPLAQVLPRMQPDLDIADQSVNTVEYSNETNIHANCINDTINYVYEHLDSVNSDKVNESYSDNCNTIGVHLKKKKKKRSGKKRMGYDARKTKLTYKQDN